MKKIIRVCLLVACVLLSARFPVYAQNATTRAQVEFTAGEGPTYPVEPENPGENVTTEPSVEGSLAIVSISHFNFGAKSVTARAGLYDIVTTQPNIQVVDLRGSGTGWKVTASVSKFRSGENESLPGAAIHIYKGRAISLSNSPAPTQATNLKLPADGSALPVITAQNGAGLGLWVMRWYPSAEETGVYIQLEVPAGIATVGSHTATINWILENAPS